jgi:hypothetical protein
VCVPVVVLVVAFAVWELSGRGWDPVRVVLPMLLGLGALGLSKVRRWRERAQWSVALILFVAVTTAFRSPALDVVTVTWWHDGRAIAFTSVILVSVLWSIRAFEHHRSWQTWVDIANVVVLFAAAAAVWEASGSGAVSYPWALGWVTVGLASVTASLGVVKLGAEVWWNVSARWLLAGVLCATSARVAFLPAARNGWGEVWLSWGWCASAALIGCAVWHPDALTLQVRRGALRRTRRRLSLTSAVAVMAVGYLLLAVADRWSAVMWVGVLGVALAWLRAVLSLRVAWQTRLAAESALSRERDARDSEQRALQQVVHRDVSQLLSAASWLVEDGEPRSLLVQAEEASLQVLHGFRPNVPSVEEIPEALAELLERFPSGLAWSFQIINETEEPRQSVVWGVVREAAVNVLKHARAENIWVCVRCEPSGCSVVVEDDGVGIKNRMNGVGLSNLRTLVGTVGGTITVGGREDGGTRVEATLPSLVEV